MRVLVTGSSGMLGRALIEQLTAAGRHRPIAFDVIDGFDVRDVGAVVSAAHGCEAIVHMAALDDPLDDIDTELASGAAVGGAQEVLSTTVLGMSNVLRAAETGSSRVVLVSSVDALGLFLGQRAPDYLPIDDAHPTYPRAPYALAKRTAELLCEQSTRASGITTICLRFPGIWTPEITDAMRQRWQADPMNDRRPFWEYGAYNHRDDAAAAVAHAVAGSFTGHGVFNVSADDCALAVQTSREAAASIHPDVPWRGGEEYDRDPFRALLDNANAKRALSWSPRFRLRAAPDTESARLRRPAG